jgi:hypothetical protein
MTELTRRGISASSGVPPEGSLLIAGEDDAAALTAGVQLTVRAAASGELVEEVGTPVSALEPERQP